MLDIYIYIYIYIYITPPGKFSWISKLIQEHEIIVLASSRILLGLHASLCTPSSAPTREWLPYQLPISIYNYYQNCYQFCGKVSLAETETPCSLMH